jgi:DNA invertase Pin-like site-specific DNA recombinase
MEKVNVILYCRVSSDEQAEGCSLNEQERQLRAYCVRSGYNVIDTYYEDYSAKYFDMKRPELKKIYDYCRKNRGKVNKILFLRWDRY